jgi:hypothetical protein
MKLLLSSIRCVGLYSLLAAITPAFAQGTAYTYQGRLNDAGSPANGNYELQFYLRDALTAGSPVGATNTVAPVMASNGLFTVMLDFGPGMFTGAGRWLEIGVRTNGSVGAYATLSPRQPLTPVPYAITASNLSGALPAAQLTGTVPAGSLSGTYGNAVTLNNDGNSFTGSGAGLTGVNAAALNGLNASNLWQLNGNNVAAGQFLGSTNNQPLELKANNSRVARYEPNTNGAPNVIGGAAVNYVAPGKVGAVIAGGGATNYVGVVYSNTVSADFGTIGGGNGGNVQATANYSTVGGGLNNLLYPGASGSTIAGGQYNEIRTSSYLGAVAGGFNNVILPNAGYGSIGGGQENNVSGALATIPGGYKNRATGVGSFAAGQNAQALHDGAFVWEDNLNSTPFASTASNQFLIRATGGLGIGTNNPQTALHVNGTVTAANFSGSGVGLSGIAGGSIIAGSISNAAIANSNITAVKIASGQVVKSLNGLTDGVNLTAGANVILTTNANTLQISSPGGGLSLPYSGTVASGLSAFTLANSGSGPAAVFLGNVGVGTSSPYNNLDVRGSFGLFGGSLSGSPYQRFDLRADTNAGLLFEAPVDSIGNKLPYHFNWTIGGSDAMTILGNGNVGLGTAAPSGSLHVVTGGAQQLYLERTGAITGNYRLGIAGANNNFMIQDEFAGGGTPRLAIDGSGNVGIGTTSPAGMLDVFGKTIVRDSTGVNGITLDSAAGAAQRLYSDYFGAGTEQDLILGTYANRANQLCLATSGKVGIGTTSPGATLEVAGELRLTTSYACLNLQNFSGANSIYFNNSQPLVFSTAPFVQTRMIITPSGNVGIGTQTPSASLHVIGNILASGTITPNSDRNAKTDFAPVDAAAVLAKVAALPILQWRFKAEEEQVKHFGPMAQDFRAAFGLGAMPTAIATVDADGVALAAIQGLNQKLNEKDTEIEGLKARLERLEKLMNQQNGIAK